MTETNIKKIKVTGDNRKGRTMTVTLEVVKKIEGKNIGNNTFLVKWTDGKIAKFSGNAAKIVRYNGTSRITLMMKDITDIEYIK